jgi:hypothetical protein
VKIVDACCGTTGEDVVNSALWDIRESLPEGLLPCVILCLVTRFGDA